MNPYYDLTMENFSSLYLDNHPYPFKGEAQTIQKKSL